nr:hypothetical protein [uncultured archaeon]AQS34139.1 hypothetical protein [uncultured archaeon]
MNKMTPQKQNYDWDRWHELLDIRSARQLTPSEQIEYGNFEVYVLQRDAEEAAKVQPHLDALMENHMERISKLEKLTILVEAQARGKP